MDWGLRGLNGLDWVGLDWGMDWELRGLKGGLGFSWDQALGVPIRSL